MNYAYRVFRPNGTMLDGVIEWRHGPSKDEVIGLVKRYMPDFDPEHVAVCWEGASRDMFVIDLADHRIEEAAMPLNRYATKLYRNALLIEDPTVMFDSLPTILGDAVIFDQRVWR
jgi:hypothetical protein